MLLPWRLVQEDSVMVLGLVLYKVNRMPGRVISKQCCKHCKDYFHTQNQSVFASTVILRDLCGLTGSFNTNDFIVGICVAFTALCCAKCFFTLRLVPVVVMVN